jgi:hypothetical protein
MRTLEGNKAFPYIVWAALIIFATLTVYLALELKKTADYLGDKMDNNVEYLEGV